MKKWILYIITLGFAVYWASNLLLWFPWSYSPVLGMTLMLTVSPIIWAYVTFLGLRSYPNPNIWRGAFLMSIILLFLAVVMDYIFFGIIRNAMEELYHPTTFYGYAFLISLPFLINLLFQKRILKNRAEVTKSDFFKAIICGTLFFGALTLIILLNITI